MSPFLHERIVLRPMNHAVADPDSEVRLALGVDQTVIVDDHVVADVNLVRVAHDDVLAEDHAVPARAKQPGIHDLAQREADRAGESLRQHDDQLASPASAARPGRPTTSAWYLSRLDCPGAKSWSCALAMTGFGAAPRHRTGRRRIVVDVRASHVRGTSAACA